MSDDIRTYEIVTMDGRIRIDVPEAWKITYGPVSPGKYSGENGMALRIYESDTKQRAIFVGVSSFRDLSLPVLREVVREVGKKNWTSAPDKRSSKSSIVLERKWVPEEEAAKLVAEPDEAPF